MKIQIKHILVACLTWPLATLLTTSCDDMLSVETGDKSYTNANDTLYSYLGILKNVQNIAERLVIVNELRGDLISPTAYMTDTLAAIANFDDPADGSCSMLNITDFYAVINNCNLYIAHADTNAVKSNIKYMLPEYAQVQAIRAWTYLKLVEMYGEVPFISEPIASLDVVKNFDYASNLVTKDNLVDRLLDLGLERYVDTDYPVYGNYNNGAVDIASRQCFFPVRLVLGDLYLLRGQDQSDYRKAAQYYYQWLRNNNAVVPYASVRADRLTGGGQSSSSNIDYTYVTNGSFGGFAAQYSYSSTNETVTLIPSSANSQFGTILTRVADIYGFTPSSSNSTETSTDDDGNEEVSTSGAISVSYNYKSQTTPSRAYSTISNAQTYVYWNTTSLRREDYTCGDARIQRAAEEFTHEGEAFRLAAKAAFGATFYYSVPVYRKTVIWLRLAEALNRAGFPELAFAILKDGLNAYNYPEANATMTEITTRTDEEGNPVTDENGNIIRDTTVVNYIRYNSYGALHYVDSTELADNFLDFTDDAFEENYGIHARGCGYGTWSTGISTQHITNLTGYNDSIVFDFAPRLAVEGVDVNTASQADIINAVENVISDELALEASFEGYRFPDLVRMAQHKNASGFNGTEWLAAKIADRDVLVSDGITTGSRNQELYSKLQNTSLWFLTKPAWTVK